MTTALTIATDVARYLEGRLIEGTATAGGAATLTDTSATASVLSPLDPGDQDSRLEGRPFVYIHTGTGIGQERQVALNGYAPSTGVVTVSRNWTTNPSTDSQYWILFKLSHAEILSCMNAALRKLLYRVISPLTLVVDGDMELDNTTNWTASGTTLTKSTTTDRVFRGVRSLTMTTTAGAASYAESTAIRCTEGETYFIEVIAHPSGTTGDSIATLVVRDLTNAVSITLNAGQTVVNRTDGTEWNRLYATFTIPEGCQQFGVRLSDTSTAGNRIIDWDDLIVLNRNRTRALAPSWLLDGIVERVFCLDGGSSYKNPRSRRAMNVTWFGHDQDRPALDTDWITWEGASTSAVFAQGLARYPTLSADSSITQADRHLVVTGALAEAYTRLSNVRGVDQKSYQDEVAKWEDKFAKQLAAFQPRAAIPMQLASAF